MSHTLFNSSLSETMRDILTLTLNLAGSFHLFRFLHYKNCRCGLNESKEKLISDFTLVALICPTVYNLVTLKLEVLVTAMRVNDLVLDNAIYVSSINSFFRQYTTVRHFVHNGSYSQITQFCL